MSKFILLYKNQRVTTSCFSAVLFEAVRVTGRLRAPCALPNQLQNCHCRSCAASQTVTLRLSWSKPKGSQLLILCLCGGVAVTRCHLCVRCQRAASLLPPLPFGPCSQFSCSSTPPSRARCCGKQLSDGFPPWCEWCGGVDRTSACL